MSEAPKVKPLSAEEVASLRAEHAPREREIEVNRGNGWETVLAWVCDASCDDLWPCDTARLLTTRDAERTRAEEILATLREMDDLFPLGDAWNGYVSFVTGPDEQPRVQRLLAHLDALLGNDSNGSTDE